MALFKKDKKAEGQSALRQNPSPYTAARAEWLERYGNYIQAAGQWRLIALFALVLCLISLSGNIMQMQQAKITPYIVEVDKLGAAVAVRPLQENGEIPKRVIQAEIVNVITRWRTVTADIDLQKKMLAKLASNIGGSAQGALSEWFEANNPYKRAEKTLVSVDVTGMPLPVSKDSWRIAWRETIRNHTGSTLDTTSFEATVSVITVPPKDEAQLMANPAGVIITSISFGKILNQ